MHKLAGYLEDIGIDLGEFAKTVGASHEELLEVVNGDPVPTGLAKRIADASGGAVSFADLLNDPLSDNTESNVIDARSGFSKSSAELDVKRLEYALQATLPSLLGGQRRRGDEALCMLAADAVANTYTALSSVTTRLGVDRLVQALQPVIVEILSESNVVQVDRASLEKMMKATSELYFQGRSHTPLG